MPAYEPISDAAIAADVARIRQLVEAGANLNQLTGHGDSLLEWILMNLCGDEMPFRYEIAKALLKLGADPNFLGEERSSPMIPAMFMMDTEMFRLLLDAGADPNKPAGFTDDESFYDWAELDYRLDVYDLRLPEKPSSNDKKDETSQGNRIKICGQRLVPANPCRESSPSVQLSDFSSSEKWRPTNST